MNKREQKAQPQDTNTTENKKHHLFELSDELLAEITGGGGGPEVTPIDTDLTCGSYNF